MSHRIRIEGTDRSFEALPGQSLLAAALGAGVAAPYGCANGNCGDCRATLLAGDVEPIAHSDFPLSAAERRDGVVLMCCQAPASDCHLRLAATGPENIEVQDLTVRVHRCSDLGEGIVSLEMRTPRSRLLRYLSGQRVRIGFAGGPERELALASCPCEGDRLAVHVAAEDGGPFAAAVQAARRGDRLAIEGPFGGFTLTAAPTRAQVFVTAGAGYAAVHSLLSQLVNLEVDVPVSVLRLTPTDGEPYLHHYCRSLVDAFDPYRYETPGANAPPDVLAAGIVDQVRCWHGEDADVWLSAGALESDLAPELVAKGLPASRLRLFSTS